MIARERILAKTHKEDCGHSSECWVWTGARTADGYGWAYFNGRAHNAHRIAYMLLVGPIPDGLQLDHLCRNRPCINPDHLEPVTSRENTKRGIAGQHMKQLRAQITHCPLGHEYTPENTVLYRGEKNYRRCRECKRLENRRQYEKRRAA